MAESNLKVGRRWAKIGVFLCLLIAGQCSAVLLGRMYYQNGGNSKWTATLVQTAGFPLLVPLMHWFPRNKGIPKQPSTISLLLLFFFLGLLVAADNLMYSYGLLYLPVTTYSLICATQLAFSAVFSYLLNAQKFTALIFNSVVLVTISASLLAVHPDPSDGSTTVSKGKYAIGFLCTIGASATYSLLLSLMELAFKKVLLRETFDAVLDMQVFPSSIASFACVVALFASGEWRTLPHEMEGYSRGKLSYVMTLVWTAISWQLSSMGLLGLIFQVSSLFSNVISSISLPAVPFLAVIFFHDRMDGVKVISLILAVWGFLSYAYQHHLDEAKSRKRQEEEEEASSMNL